MTPRGARLLGLYPEVGRAGAFWTSTLRELVEAKAERFEELIVVQDAIGDLPEAGDDDAPLRYCRNAARYAATLRGSEVRNHRRWRHRPDMLRRLLVVPEGGGLLDRYGRARSRPYFSQAYTRLHRRGLARTLTTNFHNPGSGRFLHYEALRTLTVREAARLQGIEDRFVFIKFRSAQERLVGNAFPVPLAEALARHIASQLTAVL
jgi:DNA (cytosine-5)-methyltransferase 1